MYCFSEIPVIEYDSLMKGNFISEWPFVFKI